MNRAILTGIAYQLGELEPVESLIGPLNDEDAINIMMAAGLETYSRSDMNVAELAAATMKKTLERTGHAASDIQAVLFATESFWDGGGLPEARESYRQFRRSIYKAIHAVGLKHAYPYGAMFSGCGNFVSAIRQASALIAAGLYESVLVVVADRHPPTRTRVMPPAVAVISDGAASCLVTSRPVTGFAIEHVHMHSNLAVHDVDIEDDFGRFLLEMAKSLQLTRAAMQKLTELAPDAYQKLIVNNYSLSTVRVLAFQLGFAVQQLYLDNIPRFSHAHACDVLINLADLSDGQQISAGGRVMALGSGPVTWGMMSLRKIDRHE